MASTYLSKTFSSDGNRKTFTISFWLKKCKIPSSAYYWILGTGTTTSDSGLIYFDSNNLDQLSFFNSSGDILRTSKAFRDTNAWSHIVYSVDTTQATSSDRVKLYVNGEQQTSFSIESYPAQNTDMNFNRAQSFDIGRDSRTTGGTGAYLDGSLAHFHFIDGTAYDADTFGQTDTASGIWKPKPTPSVTYGTNGFFLNFANSSDLGNDVSGNNNDFTMSGTGTQTLDTPSNVFATLNALMGGLSSVTYSNGNTTATFGATGTWYFTTSTLAASQGKYYAEVKVGAVGGETSIGIIPMETVALQQSGASDYMGKEADSIGYTNSGSIYKSNSVQESVSTYTTGDIIGIAFDLTGNSIQFYKNGTSVGSAVSLTSGLNYTIGVSGYTSSVCNVNFGNGYFGTTVVASANSDSAGLGKFEYSVPTGYYALCTKNIAEYG